MTNIIEESIKSPKPKSVEETIEILNNLQHREVSSASNDTLKYISQFFLETMEDSERGNWYRRGYTDSQDARFDERPEKRYTMKEWLFDENRDAYIQGWDDAQGDFLD